MKTTKTTLLTVSLITFLIANTGCTTTSQENGVTIEKKHSINPLNYIPYLGR